jgi:hypothetical protein
MLIFATGVLGSRQLMAIRPEDIRALVANLVIDKQLAPSTVKATYLTVAQILETSEIDGLPPLRAPEPEMLLGWLD